MTVCSRCGTTFSDDRRTCPSCGKDANPDGHDPPVQDQRRTVLDNADLRQKNRDLTARAEQAEASREAAELETAHHRQELEELAIEVELMRDEQRTLLQTVHKLGEQIRLIEGRLEALNISTHRPFSAKQVQLFGPEAEAEPKKQE